MADVNRGKRPLSPFMLGRYYRLQTTSALSILHRITGVALVLGVVLVVWWLVAAAVSPGHSNRVDGWLTSWFGLLMLCGSLWALWFHLLNGIRHLVWDTGRWLELHAAERSGWAVVFGSVALTVLTIVIFAI